MALKTLSLSWQLPNVAGSFARPSAAEVPQAKLAGQLKAFHATTLSAVMETAVRSVHDRNDGMESALQHVQKVLKTPQAAEVTTALDTLALLTQAKGQGTKAALDVVEGFAVVGLHNRVPFAQAMAYLLESLAGTVHGDDLAFVLEVARDVPQAKGLVDAIAIESKKTLLPLLRGAQSMRDVVARGDMEGLKRMQAEGTEAPRLRIHDAHLWSTWLNETELGGAAMDAHARQFPAYKWPYAPKDARTAQLDRMTGEDLFVRGRF